jgi:hypothetical protein
LYRPPPWAALVDSAFQGNEAGHDGGGLADRGTLP